MFLWIQCNDYMNKIVLKINFIRLFITSQSLNALI